MSAPAKRRPRHDTALDQGWRIQWIDHEDRSPGLPPEQERRWGVLLAAGLFLIAIVLAISIDTRFLWLALLSFVAMLASLGWAARKKRVHWLIVRARCIDRELRKTHSHQGVAWCWRWLCAFDVAGTSYRATPSYWLTFGSTWPFGTGKARAERFGRKVVSASDEIDLWVDPDNPLRCEVVGRDLKDLILHSKRRRQTDSN